jgi:hypothetical protein
VSDRLLQVVPEGDQQVLHKSLAALYDAATVLFQQPDPAGGAEA